MRPPFKQFNHFRSFILVAALTSLSVLHFNHGYGQTTEIDNLYRRLTKTEGKEYVKTYLDLGQAFITYDTVEANNLILRGREMATTSQFDDLVVRSKIIEASLLHRKKEYQSSLKLLIELLGSNEKMAESDRRDALFYTSLALGKIEAYELAIEYSKKYLKSSQNDQRIFYFITLDNIAKYYSFIEQNDSALYYFKKSYEFASKQRIPGIQITAMTNVGYYYHKTGDNNTALKYYDEITNYFNSATNKNSKDSLTYSLALTNYAQLFFDLKDFSKCKSIMEAVKKIQSPYHFQADPTLDFIHAQIEILEGKPQNAIVVLKSVEKSLRTNDEKITFYKILIEAYLNLNDFSKTKELLTNYYALLEDNSNNVELQRRISELSSIQITQTIQNLELEKDAAIKNRDLEQLKKKRMVITTILITVASLGMLILGWILYKRNLKMRVLEKNLFEQEKLVAVWKQNQLKYEISHKNQDLVDLSIFTKRKKAFLMNLKSSILSIRERENFGASELKKIENKLTEELEQDNLFVPITDNFESINHKFTSGLIEKYPTLTTNELEVCSLIRIRKSTKEIAKIKGVGELSIKTYRYRIRKKLGLHEKENLSKFLFSFQADNDDIN